MLKASLSAFKETVDDIPCRRLKYEEGIHLQKKGGSIKDFLTQINTITMHNQENMD